MANYSLVLEKIESILEKAFMELKKNREQMEKELMIGISSAFESLWSNLESSDDVNPFSNPTENLNFSNLETESFQSSTQSMEGEFPEVDSSYSVDLKDEITLEVDFSSSIELPSHQCLEEDAKLTEIAQFQTEQQLQQGEVKEKLMLMLEFRALIYDTGQINYGGRNAPFERPIDEKSDFQEKWGSISTDTGQIYPQSDKKLDNLGYHFQFDDVDISALIDKYTICRDVDEAVKSCNVDVGRDFDEALFNHFAAKFKEEYKIDVYQNARACLRLRATCEKLEKVLSANPKAPLNIECLMEGKDVRGFIKRDEFEQISVPILERVKRPLEKALQDAKLTVEDVHMVEVVGSGSRVPAIIKIMTEFFGKEPRRTMNASECVARGSALQCAILSPTFKVREFQVNESFPFPIALSWKGAAPDAQNGTSDNQQNTVVFPKGNPIPSVKALTFYRSGTFTVDVLYADVSELQVPAKISTYTIGPFQCSTSDRAKVKVKARLNMHGIVSIDSATLMEEEEVVVPVTKEPSKEASKMDTDEAAGDSTAPESDDVKMQDSTGAENGNPESGDKSSQMETDVKVEAPKKKVKKTNIPVAEIVYGGMPAGDVQKAIEKEFEMALQDRVMEETKDRKNAVEAYVYDMRNKLNDKYHDFVTDSEREELTAKLQQVEDWLYEDGEDETKGVYIAKLEELKKQGDPIEERYKEHSERGTVVDQLGYCINSYREAAVSSDPKFDHIDMADKQKVLNECVEAEAWIREKQQQQDSLPKYASPVLLSADVRRKAEAVDRVCRPIMTKPKPAKPATLETPTTPPPQGSEDQPQGEEANAEKAGEGPGEPMETDKSDTTSSA